MKTALATCATLALAALMGCAGSKTPEPEKSRAAADPRSDPKSDPRSDPNAGSISGKVNFSGDKPVMKTIDMSATAACVRAHGAPRTSEEVIVNANGTLKNVFVYVKSGLPDRSWPAPANAAQLDQSECTYRPHVLGVMTTQDIKITNGDATNHNVHPLPRLNQEWNESQPPNAGEKIKRFTKPEVMIPVKCNIHPWMRAWIGVVSHPFFAVTGDDGSFEIKGLPPGTYTLAAWHEKYGAKDLEVAVAPKADQAVTFDYKAL